MKLKELALDVLDSSMAQAVDGKKLNDGEKKAKKERRKWQHLKNMRKTKNDVARIVMDNEPSSGNNAVNGPTK
jgi:hypothetical protein